MPGVYYRMQNADSSQMLLEAFLCSVDFALNMPDADYWEMAVAATKASFPFDTWRWNLLEAYALAIEHFRSSRRTEDLDHCVPLPNICCPSFHTCLSVHQAACSPFIIERP